MSMCICFGRSTGGVCGRNFGKSGALKSIPAGMFDNCTDLRIVDFTNSGIQTIPAGLFDQNLKLQAAHFGDNDITRLPVGLFKNNGLLETIDFGDANWWTGSTNMNQIEQLPADFLPSSLPKLSSLNFRSTSAVSDQFR